MRSEGFLRVDRVRHDVRFTVAHGRARSRAVAMCPVRCAIVIGLDPGRVGGVLRRCVVGIGGRRVVSDARCQCDWRCACLCGVCLVLLCRGDLP